MSFLRHDMMQKFNMSLRTERKLSVSSSIWSQTKISENEKIEKVKERRKSKVDDSDNDVFSLNMCREGRGEKELEKVGKQGCKVSAILTDD